MSDSFQFQKPTNAKPETVMGNYYRHFMIRSVLSIFMGLAFIIKVNAQVPNWSIVNSNGGTDHDWGQSVVADVSGNTVVVGAFKSTTMAFGSTILTNNTGKPKSFIVRYDAFGNVIWAKQPVTVGNSHSNRATGVDMDSLNNIYVTGFYYSSTITFDSITLSKSNTYAAHYIVKYDPSGNIIWAITTSGCQFLPSTTPPQLYQETAPLNKIAVNKNNGDVYLTGTFDNDSMVFNSTVLMNVTPDTGYLPRRDIFLAKYDSSGNFIWAKSIGGLRQDYASDIAVSNSGIFVTGSFSSSSISIGSTILNNPNQNTAVDKHLPFVAKYDSSGNPLWARQGEATLPGIKSSRGKGVTSDLNGNCIITGEFEGPAINFGNLMLLNPDTNGLSKIYAVKYDSFGNVIWAKTFANAVGSDWIMGIKTDDPGNIYLSGNASGSLIFDSLVVSLPSYGPFIAKLNPSGGYVWLRSPGGSQQRWMAGLYVSSVGNVFTTGNFTNSITFGSSTLTSNGLFDIFKAALLNCTSTASTITAQSATTFCQGDSVILSAPSGYNSWQWYRRNYAIPGATSMNYTAKSSGRYSCKSQNATLCIDTSNVIIVNVPCIPIGPNHDRAIAESEFENQNFGIYPNPSTGIFFVESFSGQLQVFDSFGQMVLSAEVNDENYTLDISNFSNGIYFVTFNSGGSINYQKIILLH